MKKILGVFLTVTLMMGLTGCDKVPAGHVGVKVYLLGGEKGVDSEVIGTGREWVGVNEELYLYPTFTQTVSYDKAGEYDQEIEFQDRDGTKLAADVGLQYSIQKDKVPLIFQTFRMGNEELSDRVLFRIVRDAFNQEASARSVEEIYGSGKKEFLMAVNTTVKNKAAEIGVKVDEVSLLGSVRLPPNILAALNAKIAAVQKAQQRLNEVEQSKAEADKKIEEARGIAESMKLTNLEVTDKVLRLKELENAAAMIEKWNGQLPTVSSGDGAGMILQLPAQN
jgi:regulator of protease activity HflC (stomatin/prohibitin superfamily)